MTMIFMPVLQQPPRREIVKDGITYREVLPGDGASGWQILWMLLGLVFVAMPIGFVVMIWILFPMLGWLMKHGPTPF